jgi:hypothetical protein
MGNQWIEHQGKKILHNDFRGSRNEQDILSVMADLSKILTASPKKVLVLTDLTGTSVTPEVMNQVKVFGKDVMNVKIEKSAVLGITGLKNILLEGFLAVTGAKYIKPFAAEGEALKWLCE